MVCEFGCKDGKCLPGPGNETCIFDSTARCGDFIFCVNVDPADVVEESSELNNGKCIEVTITGCEGECNGGETQACGSDVTVGVCRQGTQTCAGGIWGDCLGAVEPGEEICGNLADDDCDGSVDEGCDCDPGSVMECGESIGQCSPGLQHCSAYGTWGECIGAVQPEEEICDLLDNDCDGSIDEGCSCSAGETLQCGPDVNAGICEFGLQHCLDSGEFGVCQGAVFPENEVCDNALDDDCDSEIDEEPCRIPVDLAVKNVIVNGNAISKMESVSLAYAPLALFDISIKNLAQEDTNSSFVLNLYNAECASISDSGIVRSITVNGLASMQEREFFFEENVDWAGTRAFCVTVDPYTTVADVNSENNFFQFYLTSLGLDKIYSFNPFVQGEPLMAAVSVARAKNFSFKVGEAARSILLETVDQFPTFVVGIYELSSVEENGRHRLSVSAQGFKAEHEFDVVDKRLQKPIEGLDVLIEYHLADELSMRWWLDPFFLKLFNFKRINNLGSVFFEMIYEGDVS